MEENEKDNQKQEFEKKLEKLRQDILEQNKIVQELHMEYANQISEGTLDMPVFIAEIDGLEKDVRNKLLDRLINPNNKPSLIKGQSLYEIIRLIDYLNINNYFNRESSNRLSNYIDFFSFSNYQNQIMLYLFKNVSVLSPEAADKLAETEQGVDELISIIKNNGESNFHFGATRGLAHQLVPGSLYVSFRDSYWPSKNDRASSKIPDILKNCVSSSNEKVAIAASLALYYGKELSTENIEFMLKGSNYQLKKIALSVFKHYDIKPENISKFIPLIVDLLEDERIDISQNALNAIETLAPIYSNELAENVSELLVVRSTKRPQEFFNVNTTVSAFKETFKHNPRLHGQILHKLKNIAFDNDGSVRTRAVFVGAAISKKEFLALVDEIKEKNPKTANSIANIVSGSLERTQILTEISQTDPKDIQQNAANQLHLLTRYYESGLAQAKNSFNWAIGITVFCVLSFLTIVIIFGQNEDKTIIWLSAFASGIAEIIAGTLLAIYKQSLSQLNNYNQQMSKIQNYLLANSFIESLSNETKDTARLELIKSISLSQTNLNDQSN